MPELEIVPADGGRVRRAFLNLPYRLYANDPVWVAPLRRDQKKILDERRHPFYRHAESRLFIARRGGEVVGRIAAIVDRNALPEGVRPVGWFGFFECVQDQETATRLVEVARRWLRERGMQLVRGPVNPSYNYGCGVLVEGFDDPPAIGTSYNPPYYDSLLMGAGLAKAKDLLAFSLKADQMRAAGKAAGRFTTTPPGMRLRPFDLRQREREVRWIWELHSRGFTSNYDFVPITLDEVRAMALDIERYGEQRLVQFLEMDGRPGGLLLAFPDWNQVLRKVRGRLFPLGWWRLWRARPQINRVRVFLLCMAPEFQGTGAAAAYLKLLEQAGGHQDVQIEVSWIVESHHLMLRLLELAGARRSKRYRLYEASL